MSASDEERMCGDGPAPTSRVPQRMVILIGITIGVALGVGGTVALTAGRSRVPLQMGAHTVVLDAVPVKQIEIVERAFNYFKIENYQDKPNHDGGKVTAVTIDGKGSCRQRGDAVPFMHDAWTVHVEGDVATLRPFLYPDRSLKTDSDTWSIEVGDVEDYFPVTFDGLYLYPTDAPEYYACCENGNRIEFKHFGNDEVVPAACRYKFVPVVGPMDFTGRFAKKNQEHKLADDIQKKADDDAEDDWW